MQTAQKQPNSGGRPTKYTPEIDREICSRIADDEALKVICKDDHLPSFVAVQSWLSKAEQGEKKFESFLDRYRRARQASAESVDADVKDIQRRMLLPRRIPNPDYNAAKAAKDKTYSVPEIILNPEYLEPQAGREVISAHKWRAAHLKPTVYGASVEVKHTGSVKHDHTHRVEPPDWMQAELNGPDDPPMIDVTPAADEG